MNRACGLWGALPWAGVLIGLLLSFPCLANQGNELPRDLQGIDIEERAGAQVPLTLSFRNEAGETVPLSRLVTGERPVILSLVYYSCPMLCTLVLNGLVDGLKDLALNPGQDFDVVSVSIEPRDTPELARAKKKSYVDSYGRPGAQEGWHFLTGEADQIQALASSVGFRYRWDERQQQFAHAAGLFVLTPGGRISRTLYGIQFSPRDLRLSLVEASEGTIGSPFERLMLFCFQYDPVERKYALYARNLMRLGGGMTAAVLGLVLTVLWRRERGLGFREADPARGDVHGAQ